MTDDIVEWRTTLKPSDAPSGKRLDESENRQDYYTRLAVTNTLGWNGKWRDEAQVTKKNRNALIDSIAAELDLTDFQRERARRYQQSLPDDIANGHENSSILVAISVCGFSGREDGREYHPYTHFDRILNGLDISESELATVWNKVRGELCDE